MKMEFICNVDEVEVEKIMKGLQTMFASRETAKRGVRPAVYHTSQKGNVVSIYHEGAIPSRELDEIRAFVQGMAFILSQ